MPTEIRIKDVLEDISDANDPELHRIIRVDHHGDPRQKTLRLAKSGDIPAHAWDGRWIFFKSELRQHMAANAEAK